jgi:magnesium chelatase family protein
MGVKLGELDVFLPSKPLRLKGLGRLTLYLALGPIILIIGPPGSAVTMLSRRIPMILPPLQFAGSLETTQM